MEKKQFKFELKELKEDGEFEGYAAVFGNQDKGGDVIDEGAFTKTLLEKQSFPLTWLHYIGEILGIVEAKEDGHGLKVKGKLNLAVQSAKEKYELLKQGAIKGLSIGYDTIKALFEENGAVRRLKELKLYEVALVPFPMNDLAQVTDVKATSAKAISETLAEIISWRDACAQLDDAQKKLIGDAIASLEALSQREPPGGTPGEEPPDMKSDPARDQLLGKLLDEIEGFYKILGGKPS